ncbi:hypothetical protein L7F22_002073 [Adiantum nelumboides]|nr:hypothetical protein [Adiantum nelumboides]
MLALAEKLSSDLQDSGNVTYNGHKLQEFIPQRTSAYISQHDTQYGMLTVRETFDFTGIKPDVDMDVFMKAKSIEGQQRSIITDYTLKTLGLDICTDTIVGDQMKRWISGGQRKHVTTDEMLLGPAKALFMDKILTSLDSSTEFARVAYFTKQSHELGHVLKSFVNSLYVPHERMPYSSDQWR